MPRQLSPEELQALGRSYYKLKQYDKAIDVFTQAIDMAPSLELHDHRAASHERLQDYNAAVKDGREMIRLDKQNVKGYLRTASVLEKMEKPDVALGIYKYGMKNVPVADKHFKLLRQLHDKVTRKLSPASSVDPLTVLPVELAEMVLEYLSFRHVVNCMRVSRGWRDYLAKLPRLWMHLDLSAARKRVPRSFVGKAVRRSENRLTRMTVHRFEHMDVLKNIASVCKDLGALEIVSLPHIMSSTLVDIVQCARNLKTLVVRTVITIDTATQILRCRPHLEQVDFGGLDSVRHGVSQWQGSFLNLKIFRLNSNGNHMFDPAGMQALLTTQAPNVQDITLSRMVINCDTFSLLPLTSLILKNIYIAGLSRFPILPVTLQRLALHYDRTTKLDATQGALLEEFQVPRLTNMSLSGVDQLSADRFEELLDTYRPRDGAELGHTKITQDAMPLQALSIRGSLADHSAGLFKDVNSLFGRSPRILTPALRSLDISMLPCNDDEIEHLLTYKTSLGSINLSSTQITGASIKMLADKLPTLNSIIADNCTRINGRDAIQYAKRKGVTVSCSMVEQKGGRKIRYG